MTPRLTHFLTQKNILERRKRLPVMASAFLVFYDVSRIKVVLLRIDGEKSLFDSHYPLHKT